MTRRTKNCAPDGLDLEDRMNVNLVPLATTGTGYIWSYPSVLTA